MTPDLDKSLSSKLPAAKFRTPKVAISWNSAPESPDRIKLV